MTAEERAALVARCGALLGCLEEHEAVPRGECVGVALAALVAVAYGQIAEFRAAFAARARSGVPAPCGADFVRYFQYVTPGVFNFVWLVWDEARAMEGGTGDGEAALGEMADALDAAGVVFALDAFTRPLLPAGEEEAGAAPC